MNLNKWTHITIIEDIYVLCIYYVKYAFLTPTTYTHEHKL
jgi:hypothetical protein